ncbi:hypothetical protein LWI28_018162 [Acer negundo]|uniref:Uncharacterized protein n=1 Tax=Acer negundo TaxID=4023 RepID=A0AAD5NQC6_ACENE|nr:hypothetical protein LWI28_018162 [Acer negundo]
MVRTKQTAKTAEKGDSSQSSRPRKGIPPCVPNPDFPSQLAKPCSYRTTVANEVAQLLYCLQQGQPLDIGVLIKMKIHKYGKDERKNEAMGFPSMITCFYIQTCVDLSTEEMKKPLVDIGINQWYSLYPSKGLKRPRGPKRAQTEAEDLESEAKGSKSEVEGSEPEAEDVEGRCACGTKGGDSGCQGRDPKGDSGHVRDRLMQDFSELRTRAVISDVKDRLMQDFSELRTELKVSPYSRQKKAHPLRRNSSDMHYNREVLEGISRQRGRSERPIRQGQKKVTGDLVATFHHF